MQGSQGNRKLNWNRFEGSTERKRLFAKTLLSKATDVLTLPQLNLLLCQVNPDSNRPKFSKATHVPHRWKKVLMKTALLTSRNDFTPMGIICTKRHLVTNHHIPPANFFYKFYFNLSRTFHIRNWRNKLTRQKNKPTKKASPTLPSSPTHKKLSKGGILNTLFLSLKKESVISACINWLRKGIPHKWGPIPFILSSPKKRILLPKLRHSHLQWGPEVLSPLQLLSRCRSRNLTVRPPAIKYILQTPRVYYCYPTTPSFVETPKCLKWANYNSQHDVSCWIFFLLNNDCVVEIYTEQRMEK